MAILNGTTNYILTEMEQEGTSFEETLEDAQEMGYAEKNPESDVEGMDAARKLAILSTHSFSIDVDWETIERRGITQVTKEDIEVAKAIDHHIKLIGRSRMIGTRFYASVEPMMLPEPPVMDVPPMIAPPMASSSSPRPDEAVMEEALLAAKAMPAMPANRPEMM